MVEKKPIVRMVKIDDSAAGQRIDNYLVKQLKGVPKSHIYRIIRKGEVRVNKGRIKAEYKLVLGDIVRIPPVRQSEEKITAPSTYWANVLQRAVIRENPEYLFINKPAGLAVHGGSGSSAGLIEHLRRSRPQDKSLELAHRIDKETSGIVAVARKRSSLRRLQEAWREGEIEKIYRAIVIGDYDGPARIDFPLRKQISANGDRRSVVDTEEGKDSITEVLVMERFGGATLIEVKLLTGRMHQIRCHLAEVCFPILFDAKYGDFAENERFKKLLGVDQLCLHAAQLGWPEQDWEVTAPFPSDFLKVLQRLR